MAEEKVSLMFSYQLLNATWLYLVWKRRQEANHSDFKKTTMFVMFKTCILVSSIIILFQLSENYKTYLLPCGTLWAETTFSRYELVCELFPLLHLSRVHMREFGGKGCMKAQQWSAFIHWRKTRAGCPVPIFSYFFLFFEPIPIFSYFKTKTSYFSYF